MEVEVMENKFPENMKRLRIKHGYSFRELERLLKNAGCNITASTLNRYESGDIPNVPYESIVAIANVLQVQPSVLMGWDEPTYYTDPETARLAQLLHDNPQYKVMFDSTKDLDAESVKKIIEFIKYQRHLEGYDD
jgi:transcriptional regulator with XRE-family HTH domain